MKQVKTKLMVFLAAALMTSAVFLCACSEPPASTSGSSSDSDAPKAQSLQVFGFQAAAMKGIVMTNKLGVDVDSIGVAVVDAKDEPTMLEGSTWAEGTDALVFVPQANEMAVSNFIVNAGKKQYVLHDIDFSKFDSAELCLDGKIAYLTYVQDGKTRSTLEHENDLIKREKAVKKAKQEAIEAKKKAEEEAKAKAEAEAAAQAAAEAEAAAAAQAAQEQQTWVDPNYQEPVYYEEPAYQEPTYDQTYQDQGYYEQPADNQGYQEYTE
ncbi:MAG: hypothetical protein Q4D27_07865 [Coriobacteriia bacterium]|nr:hypothetical protein [Coriobacteriia bacterium]